MKKNKFIYFLILVLIFFYGFHVFAQDQEEASAIRQAFTTSMNQNLMLARSNADYRVTPGDVYTLVYAAGNTPVSYAITVDSSYRIRVSNLGVVNGAGKTFMQLKSEIEAIVTNNYPLSGVQLVLTQTAIFKVHVKGEVPIAGEISVWALNRLSSLLSKKDMTIDLIRTYNEYLTPFTSLRDVTVRSSNGQTRVYDLFKAQRLGDLTQDPYLRPGDEITFNRIKRTVTITGEIERPGTYQLLDDENIKELIEFYGGSFTPEADNTRLELVRLVNSTDVSGDKIFISENNLANNYKLEDYDRINVPKVTQLKPVMFVEGAITNITETGDIGGRTISLAQQENLITASNRLVVPFDKGDTYASIIRKNIRWFTAVSDTQNAYILRNEKTIPINLNHLLYDSSYRDEIFVQENDILIIPFRQYFVTVAGAVISPGRYPYIPDRDWEYYVAMAGGFIAERNTRETVIITDSKGKRLSKTDAITPETNITARTNHPLYFFNQFAPVVTTLLSITSTFISIILIAR